ncbi:MULTISPECIES: hypothetical protein [Geobacter]|uniref:Cytochrome c n=1 Tax=Geobacter metallireducens (strain ATCC 53774 / DSM 7210 / GS-15) TaxID=269799 RepID=Q39YY7_GEOMG|nr:MULTISPECIES: hypothetical protein [Geobacter]ABB30537.1 cytochrome c [Geobacter metallireducens GS-15]
MKIVSKTSAQFLFVAALGAGALTAFQLKGTEALAYPAYFTTNCAGCHAAPVAATCNGCHHHGPVSLKGATNKTSYAPGESVSVTISGGSQSGWVRAILYDQNNQQVAISSGNDSGMGHSTTFPATLSAPAPTVPGTYTWKAAWFGNSYDSTNPTASAHGEVSVNTNSFTVVAPVDTTVPVVSAFTLPATSTSLTVAVSSFTATDNVGVTGYLITTSATAPAASATGWSATAPTSVTAVAGSNTFYAWAKDAAGNVSLAKSASVTVTLPDTVVPVVSAFTLPATATSLTVAVSSFTATDNVGVTGYLITKSATAPAASATGWTATAPTSVTAVAGSNTFYAWAKDAAGNVSLAKSASVTVTLPDATVPVVSAFTLPATSTSLTVAVSSFTATDNVGVTGYLITKSATAPAASATGWTATAPTSVTAVAGSNTFYAWAKDAAGNVSLAKSASVTVTLPDATAPVVSAFTLPATSTSLTVAVSSFTATDNVGVTGYLITKSATAPAASATGWTATAPTSVTAVAGNNTFYAWAKDAAGNVSLAKSASVTVTLPDTTAPVVSAFTLPATSTSLTVAVSSFTATDNVGVTGYLITTSATAPAASATGWSATAPTSVTAVAGNNTFYAWAKDAAGNVSLSKSASVTVTVAPADLTLTISALANGSYTNKGTLNISGVAIDAAGIKSVTVNGQTVTVNPDGSFSYALSLQSGANTVTVVATDNAGTQKTDIRTITYDPAAPVLTVSAPADNSTTTQSFITLNGTISETSTVSVSVNGSAPQTAAISGNSYTATVYLVKGVNTISISATDLAGNITTAKRTVTYSGVSNNLALAVTFPNQDITTKYPYLVLKGTVVDNEKVAVKIIMDGKTYIPVVDDGVFMQRLVFTTPKLYAITVIATDAAGNKSTVTRNVIYRPGYDHDDD